MVPDVALVELTYFCFTVYPHRGAPDGQSVKIGQREVSYGLEVFKLVGFLWIQRTNARQKQFILFSRLFRHLKWMVLVVWESSLNVLSNFDINWPKKSVFILYFMITLEYFESDLFKVSCICVLKIGNQSAFF